MKDIKLRDKKWVEFIQHVPDRDAVADQFYQFIGKGSKIRKFKAGQAELILELDYDVYLKINEHREHEEVQKQRLGGDGNGAVGLGGHVTSSSSQTSHVYDTAQSQAPVAAALSADHAFPAPTLLPPPSVHQEMPIHDSTRVNAYAGQIALGPRVSRKRDRELENEPTKSLAGHLPLEVTIPPATTVLSDIPGSLADSSSKRLRGALLGIKMPGAKIIKKMSKS